VFQHVSGPRNAVSDTDGCTQRVAAKFIAPVLPSWPECASRDGAWVPGLDLLLEIGQSIRKK